MKLIQDGGVHIQAVEGVGVPAKRSKLLATHLVDRVFLEVPVRQWVLSLPFALRYLLASGCH